ncbi:MAG: ABC transporter permease, partial [Coriobacteriales bacterium]|nr:ABC transporter permease [Coriobacteriales bacterium]
MTNIFYYIKEAFINFKRNWSTSLGAVITIFLSLFVIGIFMIAGVMVEKVVESVEDKVSIQVFISDDADSKDVDALKTWVNNLPYVSNVKYTSKEEALEKFTTTMTSNPEIIEQLDGTNPLPASLDIDLVDVSQANNVAEQILNNETFLRVADRPDNPAESIKYGQDTVTKLVKVTTAIRYAGLGLVALLVFVTFIFINNTIRLAILARRKEISIMRLVGASNGFIRGPFIMESILQALIAAGLAIGSIAALKEYALPKVYETLSFLNVNVGDSTYLYIYLILLVAGL